MQKKMHIRTMAPQEVGIAIDWAAAEGWNPGMQDADCFFAADPNGFLVGLLDNNPVAVISVVRYSRSFGFLGLYIVKPGFRGMGYGIQIWHAGLGYLSGATIGLDGVVAQQANYKKSGFALAHRNIRYQGQGGGTAVDFPDMVPLSRVPLDHICAYDRLFFPAARRQFLQYWIDQRSGKALCILRKKQIAGYGVLRLCRLGYKIGPLFADTPGYAEQLFLALKAAVPAGAPIFLDTPAVNAAAVELAKTYHMTPVFETARMYKGSAPVLPLDNIFGVTTFELG
jgi:hypothetical protein